MQSIEKTGRTVDEAIEAALEELDLRREEVEVDIIQIESSGLLGLFGRKEAKVRVTPLKALKTAEPTPPRRPKPQTSLSTPPRREKNVDKVPEKRKEKEVPSSRQTAPQRAPQPERSNPPSPRSVSDTPISAKGDLAAQSADILVQIAKFFGTTIQVKAREEGSSIQLQVSGEDVGQLIGRRGRTLAAVQYMISRLINEDRPEKRKITIDVDGYSEIREKSLQDLTLKVAQRVEETGEPEPLQPMNPQERRIIHLTLQDHPKVGTESVGEETRRFVVIYPRDMPEGELRDFLNTVEPAQAPRPSMRRSYHDRSSGPRGRSGGGRYNQNRGPRSSGGGGGGRRGPRPTRQQ